MKRKASKSKPTSQTVEQARAAAKSADAGASGAKERARAAKARFKAAKKALKEFERQAKKARKEARRARKVLEAAVARRRSAKKRSVAPPKTRPEKSVRLSEPVVPGPMEALPAPSADSSQ
jgi:hypothetical protein